MVAFRRYKHQSYKNKSYKHKSYKNKSYKNKSSVNNINKRIRNTKCTKIRKIPPRKTHKFISRKKFIKSNRYKTKHIGGGSVSGFINNRKKDVCWEHMHNNSGGGNSFPCNETPTITSTSIMVWNGLKWKYKKLFFEMTTYPFLI